MRLSFCCFFIILIYSTSCVPEDLAVPAQAIGEMPTWGEGFTAKAQAQERESLLTMKNVRGGAKDFQAAPNAPNAPNAPYKKPTGENKAAEKLNSIKSTNNKAGAPSPLQVEQIRAELNTIVTLIDPKNPSRIRINAQKSTQLKQKASQISELLSSIEEEKMTLEEKKERIRLAAKSVIALKKQILQQSNAGSK